MLNDSAEFFQAGRYRAVIRMFDEAWVITRPDGLSEKTGYVVSLERDTEEPTVDIGQCIQHVEAAVTDDYVPGLEDDPSTD